MNIGLLLILISILLILISILLMGIGLGCLGGALLLFSEKEAEKVGREEAIKMIAEVRAKIIDKRRREEAR